MTEVNKKIEDPKDASHFDLEWLFHKHKHVAEEDLSEVLIE